MNILGSKKLSGMVKRKRISLKSSLYARNVTTHFLSSNLVGCYLKTIRSSRSWEKNGLIKM